MSLTARFPFRPFPPRIVEFLNTTGLLTSSVRGLSVECGLSLPIFSFFAKFPDRCPKQKWSKQLNLASRLVPTRESEFALFEAVKR